MNKSITDHPSFWPILNLLADGKFHSGEQLGVLLGVSRAAVWKQLQKLQDIGVSISSVKGKGYRVEGGLDFLNADCIKSMVPNMANYFTALEIIPVVDSTNSYLLRQINFAGRICLAEAQTAGRGRRGRAWLSPFAQNIYLSVGWEFNGGVAALGGLSLVVGIAIIRALRKLNIPSIQLKWPNDVLYRNKKLAGILIEMTGDPSGVCQVVIGIGVNVAMRDAANLNIGQPWVDLQSIIACEDIAGISRNQLAAALINELILILSSYHQYGFTFYREEWESLNAYRNMLVELRNGETIHKGILCGIDDSGALRLGTEKGEEAFHGGELSLRIAP